MILPGHLTNWYSLVPKQPVDRWRQIINEPTELKSNIFYIATGYFCPQLDEMSDENVILVVPRIYLDTYPKKTGQYLDIKEIYKFCQRENR